MLLSEKSVMDTLDSPELSEPWLTNTIFGLLSMARQTLSVILSCEPNVNEYSISMTREMIWQLEQLQELFKYVKDSGLEFTVKYEKLWDNSKIDLQAGRDVREVIVTHLCDSISAAIELVNESCGNECESSILTKSTLVTNKLQRPSPEKVFRKVK
jgi:hypothetical protein